MELGLTDFENAAHVIFVALVAKAILYFDLNLYIPISKVDANMKTAHERDAATKGKFFFRKVIKSCLSDKPSAVADEYTLMSMSEILCGKAPDHPGLIALVKTYLDMIGCDAETVRVVYEYIDLLAQRACGKKMTIAAWLRRYALVHPDYKQDGVVSPLMAFDIMQTACEIGDGTITPPQLFEQKVKFKDPDAGEEEITPELSSAFSLSLPAYRGCEEFRKFLNNHLHCVKSADPSKEPVAAYNPCA